MATIIKKTPDQNGAFGNQSWPEACPAPEGYAVIPEAFGPVWEQHKPFVSVTFRDDVITGMADNPEGRAAQAVIDNDIGPLQAAKQAQNNAAFAAFLAAHPIPFTDGKLYGVTLSDQNEIALNPDPVPDGCRGPGCRPCWSGMLFTRSACRGRLQT